MLARNAKIGATIPADRLMSIYDAQLKQVHTWLSARSNFGGLVVKHADLMSDGATQARRMNAFLGGDLNEAAMANAIDPSLHRNKV